jgi:TolB protein
MRGRIDAIYQEERRSPDGWTVFVQAATGRSDANLYMTSSDGANTREITTYAGDEYDPVWARVGDRIAFVANHTGNDEIWVMGGDGSGQRQLTVNNWEWDKHPTWSPDGNQIAFFSNRSGQRQIWVMNADGSNPRNVSHNGFDDWDPVWIK